MDQEIVRETLRDRLGHASDLDLERYHLGMIAEGPELAALEEHLLICAKCVDRAEETGAYVDSIRAGIVKGNFSPTPPDRR